MSETVSRRPRANTRRVKNKRRITQFTRSSVDKVLINASALATYIKRRKCSILEAADAFDIPICAANRLLFMSMPGDEDIAKALNIYDMGFDIKEAALASKVSISDIGKAISARNKQYKTVKVFVPNKSL